SVSEIAARAAVRNEMAVQSALIILEKAGHIERGSSSENRAALRLLVKPHEARASAGARETKARQVLFGLLGGFELNERTDIELDVTDFAESIGLDLPSVRRALSQLNSSGIISYNPARRTRGVLLLDEKPASSLRIRPQEVARRAALEQRKLREMISFCYTDSCYRAFILDYFGDPHHAPNCGTCGNCTTLTREDEGARRRPDRAAPMDEPTSFDDFVREHVPVARDLEHELDESSRLRRAGELAEVAANAGSSCEISVTQARALTDEESLLVRKVLACAARMQGRFGKGLLASTLRGSRARNVLQAGLAELSTYGILDDMTQEELMTYIDALVAAGCLRVTGGAYPTVSLTALGGDVMRERASVELALPETSLSALSTAVLSQAPGAKTPKAKSVSTVDETYALYTEGLAIEEICERRGLTEITVEKHLAECIMQGRAFDISRHVSDADRARIESAIGQLGTQLLRPLRDALPPHINYRMIRFIVADVQRAEQAIKQESEYRSQKPE
ncbi:MAG TPA: RQC domain-containing protein, partial [Pyrinomonadaceae bacterium]